MNDWNFSHIFQYWDQRTGAIALNSERLDQLGTAAQSNARSQIREALEAHVEALDDELLLQAAISQTDDLYKYINDEVVVRPALFYYLAAFGRTLNNAVRERGYVIEYVVENQFSGPPFLFRGPFGLFPKIFQAVGFVYVCPQQLAWQMMQQDGVAEADYSARIAQYASEGWAMAHQMARTCHTEGRHFIYLETDYVEGSLDAPLEGKGAPGVLSIFRNEAAVAGSTVTVDYKVK